MKKSKRTNILLALIGLIMCVFAYKWASTILFVDLITYESPLPDQHGLFTENAKKLLHFRGGSKETSGQPSSCYVYDGKYEIIIYKCVLTSKSSIEGQIHIAKNEVASLDGFYTSSGSDILKIKDKSGRRDTTSFLDIDYEGELINSKFEKNLFYSFLRFKNYSLSYDNDRIFLSVHSDLDYAPVSIAVVKKDKYLYIINMVVYNEEDEMPKDLLYDLIVK